jgi:hypothetical protein
MTVTATDTDTDTDTQLGAQAKLPRRRFIAAGVAGALGVLGSAEVGAAATRSTSWPVYTSGGPDGASIRVPPLWAVDPGDDHREASFNPSLVYPHQSFAVRSAAVKPPIDVSGDADGLPNLDRYPADSAIIWLMYYDEVFQESRVSELSLAALTPVDPSPARFAHYVGRFANNTRSFLLWVWAGNRATASTMVTIDSCVRSITIP